MMALAGIATAAENAVFKNGQSMRHEHRKQVGAVTRLYLDAGTDSFVDVPTEQIKSYEKIDEIAVVELAPVAVVVVTKKQDLDALVKDASERSRIDAEFLKALIKAESGFNPKAVSPKGARGLMQLMPATAKELGVADSFDAKANIEAGTRHLLDLLKRYEYDAVKALAAYNAGASRVDRYKGVPPYRETQAYVAKIIREYNAKKLAERRKGSPSNGTD